MPLCDEPISAFDMSVQSQILSLPPHPNLELSYARFGWLAAKNKATTAPEKCTEPEALHNTLRIR
jgi:hypothetical protein